MDQADPCAFASLHDNRKQQQESVFCKDPTAIYYGTDGIYDGRPNMETTGYSRKEK
ncbi:hypothetical protein D3C80_1724650 [compost metagenome]